LGVILNSSGSNKKEKKQNSLSQTDGGQSGILSNQKRSLFKSEAHHLKPAVTIGQDGLTPSVIQEIDLHLDLHELIKIRVLGDQRALREQFAQSIVRELKASLVQHIGKTLIIYRKKAVEAVDPQKMPAKVKSSGSPREVKVRKVTRGTRRNPLKIHTILGNQRITQGGLVKRVKKKRQSSAKKAALGD
jgi:RNA-binding protein